MLKTSDHYRESLRDSRQVWTNGEKVRAVPTHPALEPIVVCALDPGSAPSFGVPRDS